MKEVWRSAFGFEGFYEVSNLGRVRSLTIFRATRGHGLAKRHGRILRPAKVGKGYLAHMLSKNGVRFGVYVHILVWTSFVGPVSSDMEINHEDGDKTNCCLANLSELTHQQNIKHALENGLMKRGTGGRFESLIR